MANTLKFGNGEWYGKEGTILAYNSENNNYKPLPFTFDRDSVATRVNKQGLIETVGADQPRVDYLNNTKGALKLEPSRTNLVEYSEDGTQWDTINATVSLTTDSTSPSGQSSVYKVNDDANDAQHRVDVRPSVTNGTEYTFSAFVKQESNSDVDFVYLIFTSNFSTTRFYFNIKEGTSLDSGGIIENYGNGWYKISGTATANSSGNGILGVNLANAYNNNTYSGTGNGSMFVWGLQLEAGSYATSYIKSNSGSAVTRLADVCVDAGNDQVINSTEGVLYAEIAALFQGDGENRCITLHYGVGNSNTVEIFYQVSANTIKYRIKDGNGANINHTETVTDSSQFNKCAIKYKSGDTSMWLNGVKVDTDTSTFAFTTTLSELNFSQGNGIEEFYGNVKDVRVYNTALTDQELIALTS